MQVAFFFRRAKGPDLQDLQHCQRCTSQLSSGIHLEAGQSRYLVVYAKDVVHDF